jgi:NarL family two-component system response regulator LiaR
MCVVGMRSIFSWLFRGKMKPLSRRETQVLHYLAEGKTDKEIANVLNISPETVKNHVQRIYRKIGVHRRTRAAVWAVQNGAGQLK